jgi:hypothetical protein
MSTPLRCALFVTIALACSKPDAAPPAPTPSASTSDTAAKPASEHVETDAYTVDFAPAGSCAVGAACELAARVRAKGDFHMNQDFPYKLRLDDAAEAKWLGKDPSGANTFSKAAGDFTLDGEKSGAIRARFEPSAPGPKVASGTLRFSVCNAANCMLEQVALRTTVPVK